MIVVDVEPNQHVSSNGRGILSNSSLKTFELWHCMVRDGFLCNKCAKSIPGMFDSTWVGRAGKTGKEEKGRRTRKREKRELEKTRVGRFRKRRGESQSFLFRDADQESKTRMINNALRTGPRQAVDDEAHFWLNGYNNKQNCRIWSEANPQVYVETPLHPEKLTFWCSLWAGGIIGPYFLKNDEGHNVTVNGDRYRAMLILLVRAVKKLPKA
ncbi:DUF4817 domain-containing protein [Trichonephila clavipes]|nr:DUF4817 domain-containing protein [Trichonephila clavipes]